MSGRGTETRQRLVDTALRLFREHGFAPTTMRRIADAPTTTSRAGTSRGKDELVQDLYRAVQLDHRDRALPLLRDGAPLAENLAVVLHTGLDVMTPYHGFGTTFVGQVRCPRVPGRVRSPWSPRRRGSWPSTSCAGPSTRPRALEEALPTLLWLVHLGGTLHWVTDVSPGQRRTPVRDGHFWPPGATPDDHGLPVASPCIGLVFLALREVNGRSVGYGEQSDGRAPRRRRAADDQQPVRR